jgi:AraC-like DNA-binding protein
MPRTDLEITSRIVPLALAYAINRGLDVRPLISRHGLPDDLELASIGKLELTLPAATTRAVVDDLANQLGDPHFGLTLARAVPRGTYGVAEFLVRATSTIRQACENLVRVNRLMAPHQQFRFVVTDTEGELHHGVPGQPTALSPHHHLFSTEIMLRTFHSMLDDGRVNRVWFADGPRADSPALAAALGVETLQFDAELNGFSFDLAVLERPVKGGDPALYAFLEEHAEQALASRPNTNDLVERLRAQIREALKQGEPNIERLATRMSVSGRTLQRRLSDLGTSFQAVLDDVRFDLARAYLREARLDITQVAYLLGYSELRAFDRAFKRWANVTPREWRDVRPS